MAITRLRAKPLPFSLLLLLRHWLLLGGCALLLVLLPAANDVRPTGLLLPLLPPLPKLQIGDLVFRQGLGQDSALICALSESAYSHVGMVVEVTPEVLVVHATTDDDHSRPDQVIVSTLAAYVHQGRRLLIKRYPLTARQKHQVQQSLWAQQGKPFMLTGKRDELYCSTLVSRVLAPFIEPRWPYSQVQMVGFSGEFLFPETLVQDQRSQTVFAYPTEG